ncbi:MAG: DUF1273 family protein [Clostridia bacterium]|nr:DUF1273 family protein [Clostridia bacterium]
MFCCFTGHRPQSLLEKSEGSEYIIKLKNQISLQIEKAIEDGFYDFYTGMAQGTDTFAAEEVLKKQQNDNRVKLHAAIPCEMQANSWNEKEKERYKRILEKCESVIYVSRNYYRGCMQQRNKFMVDNSERVIAVWNGENAGGTAFTIKYASRQGKEIYLISSNDLTVKKL